MTAKHDPFATGGPGQSGAAPATEAAGRMASAPGAPPEEAGGERQESATATLAGGEPEPGADNGFAQESGAGIVPGAVAEPGAAVDPEPFADSEPVADPEAVADAEAVAVTSAKPDAAAPQFDDHEAGLEHDLEELTAKAEKADEYLELARRTKDDFENYRKRAAREAAAAQERGMVKLARELLPAVDNLDRALAAARTAGPAHDGSATLVSGIKLVHADVIAALARVGIEPFSPQGEPFDPQYHEAIAQQPIEGAEPGTGVEVSQRGFRLGDRGLPPARVVVAG